MNSVEIRTEIKSGVAVIYPGPYLNQLKGEGIESHCQQLLARGLRHIVINFAETELINSIGISILLGVIEVVNDARGELILSDLSPTNRELFEMLGLLAHLGVEPTEEAAIRRLAGRAGVATR